MRKTGHPKKEREHTNFRLDPSRVRWRIVDGKVIILNLENGIHYTLNDMGKRMWEGLVSGVSPETIIESIVSEYDVGREEAGKDLERLIRECNEGGFFATYKSSCTPPFPSFGENPSYRHVY